MKSPQNMFSSVKTRYLYDMLTSFHTNNLPEQQKNQLHSIDHSIQKRQPKQNQYKPPKYTFIPSRRWSIETSQSKSSKSKSKHNLISANNTKTNSYFKSNNCNHKNQDHINIIDNQTFDELNKSAVTNRPKTKHSSKAKSRLFTKTKLESIKKTIQFVEIYSQSKPYVYVNKYVPILSKLLKERYWLQPTNQIQKSQFLWVNYKDLIDFQRIRIQQIKVAKYIEKAYLINHLSLDTTKLFQQLSNKIHKYIPLTFQLSDNSRQLKKIINMINKQQKIRYWIIKPSNKANFSNSHICTRDQIKQYLTNLLKSNKYHTFQLIQQYIYHPFLYKHRKFIIKTYLLVTNITAITKAYLCNKFYIQTSALEYKADSKNLCIHYTGNEIQRQSKYYERHEQNNRIKQEEFNEYIQVTAKQNQELNIEYKQNIKQICLELADIITKKTNNFYDHLNYFQVFQLNFIIQNNGKPLLIGLKPQPNLSIKHQQKQTQRLVSNVLKLSLDVLFPPPLSYLKKYQLIPDYFNLIFDSRMEDVVQRLPLSLV